MIRMIIVDVRKLRDCVCINGFYYGPLQRQTLKSAIHVSLKSLYKSAGCAELRA